jgi:hypothetical protein
LRQSEVKGDFRLHFRATAAHQVRLESPLLYGIGRSLRK